MTVQVTTTDYLLPVGQTLTTVDALAVSLQVAADAFATVTIAGHVQVTASPQSLPQGVLSGELDAISTNFTTQFYGGQVVVNSGAVVSIDTTGSRHTTSGIADSAGQEVLNFGLVQVTSDVRAVGISVTTQTTPGGPSQFENAGTIDVTSNQGDAIGGQLVNGAGGENTGVIHVSGSTSAIGLQTQQISTFNNSGEIVAHDTAAGVRSIAVNLGLSSVQNPSFTNSGHIEGDVALKLVAGSFFTGAFVSVQNSGQMIGEVDIAGESTTLTNTGVITGSVNFSSSADTYDGRLGTETGLVSGMAATTP